jgi:hypothetical protein
MPFPRVVSLPLYARGSKGHRAKGCALRLFAWRSAVIDEKIRNSRHRDRLLSIALLLYIVLFAYRCTHVSLFYKKAVVLIPLPGSLLVYVLALLYIFFS